MVVIGDVVVNLVGDGDVIMDDHGGGQVAVSVNVVVADYDQTTTTSRSTQPATAPSNRNHWRRREHYVL